MIVLYLFMDVPEPVIYLFTDVPQPGLLFGVNVPNPRPDPAFIKKTRQPVHFGLMQKLKGLFSKGDHIYAVSYAGKTLFWVRRNCKS